jgi:predicted nuclease of predicted toxin-antitoxin system
LAFLVLDEQFANPRLVLALRDRGIEAATVEDFGVMGGSDPDVVRKVQQESGRRAWVLVTMDLTIVEEHRGFAWERYAIAWVILREGLRGLQVEREKSEIVHRYAHLIREQKPGDHHTYTPTQHFRQRPSLTSMLRRTR